MFSLNRLLARKTNSLLILFYILVTSLGHLSNASEHDANLVQKTRSPFNLQDMEFLESDNPSRERWIGEQNRKSLARVKATRNENAISEQFRKLLEDAASKNPMLDTVTLKNGSSVYYTNPGINKPNEVILKRKSGVKDVLLNSFTWARKNTFNFVKMTVSPGEQFLAVTVSKNGAINDFIILIYDLYARETIGQVNGGISATIAWKADSEFYLEDSLEKRVYKYEIRSGKITRSSESYVGTIFAQANDIVVLYSDEKNISTILQRNFPPILLEGIRTPYFASVASETELKSSLSKIWIQFTGTSGQRQIVEISRSSLTPMKYEKRIVVPESEKVIGSFSKQGDSLFVFYYWGPSRWLRILNLRTHSEVLIPLPENASVTRAKWIDEGKTLEMSMTSAVVSSRKYVYSLVEKKFYSLNAANQISTAAHPDFDMLESEGEEYVNEFSYAKSTDGVLIPFRVVQKKGTPRNGTRGALVYMYGGFAINSSLHPNFSLFEYEFLKRGGTLIFPAPRGGAEFGESWNRQAQLAQKYKTMDDVNSVVELAQKLGIMDRKKTVISGASNGGYVSASAALRRPDLYAAVVPQHGVYDLLNFSRYDYMCQALCFNEYGDASIPEHREFMKLTSPLELTKNIRHGQEFPEFFLLSGRQDTRVGPRHSYKFAFSLMKNAETPSRVYLLSVQNAGHWVTSEPYQDVIGWRIRSYVWSLIFEMTKVKF